MPTANAFFPFESEYGVENVHIVHVYIRLLHIFKLFFMLALCHNANWTRYLLQSISLINLT